MTVVSLIRFVIAMGKHPASFFWSSAVVHIFFCIICNAQETPPHEAVTKMQVGEGLAVQLVASEPLVRQPVAIEFDDRGRLWVIQYLQYPNPAELKRVQVDRYSRTKYDRVPEPPPLGPKGADRISILEDSDGDGVMDRAKDFVGDLNLASGIAFGHGGVYVLNVPYLLFYADRNRDDVPDGPPEVLLSGFGMEDAHSVANSLTWGPDGWLYGCQGSTVTANIRGIEFQQGVWRYHPIHKTFELFCEGGGNSWGLDFDSHGTLLYSTNYGGHVMLHAAQGGYFIKSFAKHGELHNPHSYGFLDHAPHSNFQGGHVTVGGIVYQAELLPAQFRGKYIAGDLLGHSVQWHHIDEDKSSYKTAHGGLMFHSNDPWFAPTDVTVGPEGAIYVADWHDRRTAHPDPDADWDRSNGRIYRIVPNKLPQRSNTIDFSMMNDSDLLSALENPNQWYVRRSRMELVRRFSSRSDESSQLVRGRLREFALDDAGPVRSLESLWTLYCLGGFDESLAERLLASSNADVRAWTVRFLGDIGRVSDSMAHVLDGLAERENSIRVRHHLASMAARLPASQALPVINANINRDVDSEDERMCLLWWWAIERHSVTGRDEVLKRFLRPTLWQSKLGRDFLLPRLVRRYVAENSQEGFLSARKLLQTAHDEESRTRLWHAVRLGLNERPANSKNMESTEGFSEKLALTKLAGNDWQLNKTEPELLKVSLGLGIEDAMHFVVQKAFDTSVPSSQRVKYLELIASSGATMQRQFQSDIVEKSRDVIQGSDTGELPMRKAIVHILGNANDIQASRILLQKLLDESDELLHAQIVDTMLLKESSCLLLLQAVASGQLQPERVPTNHVRRIGLFNSEKLNTIVAQHWGKFEPTSREEKLAEVRRLNNDLRAGSGNPDSGKLLFGRHCASCHELFGQGKKVGPDLTTANRQDREFLLVSLVDPSSSIRREFLSILVQTHDGRVFSGFPLRSDEASLTLVNSRAELIEIARSDVSQTKESQVSIMPDDLYRVFTPQHLRDLFSYLQGKP